MPMAMSGRFNMIYSTIPKIRLLISMISAASTDSAFQTQKHQLDSTFYICSHHIAENEMPTCLEYLIGYIVNSFKIVSYHS